MALDPGTCNVDQAGLKLRDLPVSASWGLELKALTTTPVLAPFTTLISTQSPL